MSVSLGANGSNYNYPETGELSWGANATNYASAVSAALAKLGLGGTLTTNAVVDIASTTKAIRIPSMTTTQRNNIATPLTGFLIYNTTTNRFNVYYSSAWHEMTIAESIYDNGVGVGIGSAPTNTGKIEIYNTNNPWCVYARSTSSGGIFFGDIDDSSTPAATTLLSLRYGSNSGNEVLFVDGNGDVRNINNSYGAISDIRLKENIVDTTPKLDDILKVKIRNFNLKGSDKKQLGVIAQELEQVFPSMVDETINENGDSIKSVKYSVFVPILIKAMQEQNELIENLKSRIEALEAN